MRPFATLALVGATLLSAIPVSAQESALQVSLSSTTVTVEDPIAVTGSGCGPSTTVTVSSAAGGPGGLVATGVADAGGSFSIEFVFPEDLVSPGPADLNVFCNDADGFQLSRTFDVTVQGLLPFTGLSHARLLLGVAALLVLTGVVLLTRGAARRI